MNIEYSVINMSGLKEAPNLIADVEISAQDGSASEVFPVHITARIPLPAQLRSKTVVEAREAALTAAKALIPEKAIAAYFQGLRDGG